MKEVPNQSSIEHPQPTTGNMLDFLDVRVVVFGLREDRLQVILTSSSLEELAGSYELPGSPIPDNRSLDETATESVLSLSGLREAYLEQLFTYGDSNRHPKKRLVSVVYFAIIPAGSATSSIQKDEQWAKWFPVDDLPEMVMDHREVIDYALRRLRYKLEYTAVGFQLLPEQFSLSQLQKMYEMILGEKLDKRNFRRRILQAGIIESTSHLRSGEGRPARLFRYRPDAVAEVKARRLFP